jgi:hypothetical protein
MKKIDVLVAAAEELGVSYENNALWFEVLLNQALKTHKTPKLLEDKMEVVEVIDNKFTLPSDLHTLTSICTECKKNKYCEGIQYCLQNDVVVFDDSVNLADGTKLEVRYRGLALDEHGDIKIPHQWERMLVAYIGWKYTRRFAKEYPAYVMQSFQREYQTQKLANT